VAGKASKWSKEKVVAAILARRDAGLGVTSSEIRKDDTPLRGAIATHFGGTDAALLAAGIDPISVKPLTYWNKQMIRTEFLRIRGSVSSVNDLSRQYRSLDHAIRKHYGTYDALCDDLGIDVTTIRKQVREWSGDDLLAVLREMRDEGQPLNITNVHARFPSIHPVAVRCFGSYENALAEIGEKIQDHICEMKFGSYLGKKFERKLNEAFEALNMGYKYQKRLCGGSIMPDFWDESQRTFIDAKLSSWTVFCSSSIEKYLPHCNKLIVVYLRGEEIAHEIPNLELRHVSHYYPALVETGNEELVSQFEDILREASTEPTTEVLAA